VAETPKIYPVILSGGSGSRLWPLSREDHPKQLQALVSGRTLLQETALRLIEGGLATAPPIVVCNEVHRFIVPSQLAKVGVQPEIVFVEPEGKNTAPAIAVAALYLRGKDPDAIMLVMPSDHTIQKPDIFADIVRKALAVARAGRLVTLGITPSHPSSAYGYIKRGTALPQSHAYGVAEFVEKPDPARARDFLNSGDYYWNSGIFLFSPDAVLGELEKFEPAVVAHCRAALDRGAWDKLEESKVEPIAAASLERIARAGEPIARKIPSINTDIPSEELAAWHGHVSRAQTAADGDQFFRLEKEAFAKITAQSIDYGVMERTAKAAVIPAPVDMGWSDVGSWSALAAVVQRDRDARGNVLIGDVLAIETADSYVRSDKQLVTVLGVKDLAVVVTPDVVLVANKDRDQEVKALVDRLKSEHRNEALQDRRTYRPWGWFETVDQGPRFKVKRLCVKPGGQLSLQKHAHRSEHWVVVTGRAWVTCDGKNFFLRENESTFIPPGSVHRLANPWTEELHMIEVQSGSYVGEDDIVRLADTYGRDAAKPDRGAKARVKAKTPKLKRKVRRKAGAVPSSRRGARRRTTRRR